MNEERMKTPRSNLNTVPAVNNGVNTCRLILLLQKQSVIKYSIRIIPDMKEGLPKKWYKNRIIFCFFFSHHLGEFG